MRDAFASAITDVASRDPRVFLLSGDIGNRLFNDFKSRFPGRFLNCGVAEANMTGVAAGLALCGIRPVTYTIAAFNTARCFEQIKIDLCYHGLPVVVVGVGAGLSYAELGATHAACEDIAILRSLPNLAIVCPGDAVEVTEALRAALEWPGPVYLRLGKKGEPRVHKVPPEFRIGRAIVLEEGADVCLLSTGTLLPATADAARELRGRGISAELVSFHTVKPLDEPMLSSAFSRFSVVATVEEHGAVGGFGASVAEWLADRPPQRARLCRITAGEGFVRSAGHQSHAREILGLTPSAIAARVLAARLEAGSLSKAAA